MEEPRSLSPTGDPPGPAIPAANERIKRIRDSSFQLEGEAHDIVKKLKRSTDDSQDYWQKLSRVHDLRSQIKTFTIEREKIDFLARGGSEEEFETLELTLRLIAAIEAHKKQKLLYEEHNQKLKSSSVTSRVWASMFTCSRLDLNVDKAGVGGRERSDQRAFKEKLLKDYDLEPERQDKTKRVLSWSVAHGNWVLNEILTAAHIFPVSWGQKMMKEMCGEECKDELFSARNGLLLPTMIERAMDDWAIVIVPDLPNDPTIDKVKPWIASMPREYKFRVLDPNHPELNKRLSASDDDTRSGKDLDQSPLVFRNDFRPRARFLWLFTCAILKRFWSAPIYHAPEKLTAQFGKGMWATGGPYLRKDFVLGIVEEIGHEVADFMLKGAMPSLGEEDEVPNKAVAAMLASRVVEVCEKEEGDEDDDEIYEEYESREDENDEFSLQFYSTCPRATKEN